MRCLGRQRAVAAVSLAWASANSSWYGCAETIALWRMATLWEIPAGATLRAAAA